MVGTQLSSVYATLYRLACGMQGPTKITENRMIRSLALLVTCCNMAYGLYMCSWERRVWVEWKMYSCVVCGLSGARYDIRQL